MKRFYLFMLWNLSRTNNNIVKTIVFAELWKMILSFGFRPQNGTVIKMND